MTNIKRPPVICWFDALPRVSAGVFSHLENCWGAKVIFIVVCGMDADHKRIGWQEFRYDNEVIRLSEEPGPDKKISEILAIYPDAIHYVNGLRSLTKEYLYRYLFPDPNKKIVLWSEIPNLINPKTGKPNILRYIGLRLLNCIYGLKFRNRVQGYTPLGQVGCQYFKSCFWHGDKLFPMMYCPPRPSIEFKQRDTAINSVVRFVYVGRLSKLKGCDLLPQVFDSLEEKNWTLDIYGTNGNYENELKDWGKNCSQVDYKGVCPSDKVIETLTGYDVAIVSSRCEGWNLLPNESFYAGNPVIASNRCGSHEIIEASGGGIVVQAGSVSALREAISKVLKNPGILEEQRKNILMYRGRIMPEVVAQYLCEIFDYLCLNSEKRPRCPWLNEK